MSCLNIDPILWKDAINFSPSDVMHLTRRLEAVAKDISLISPSLSAESSEVHELIHQVIDCFLTVGEKTRVARCLEKILVATGPQFDDLVKTRLGCKLEQLFLQLTTNGRRLKAVSALLEHSKLVQAATAGRLPLVFKQLSGVFAQLATATSGTWSREETLLYAVKVSLQLFQQLKDLRQLGWFHLQRLVSKPASAAEIGSPGEHVASAVKAVFDILTKNVYGRDVTLLAGTTLSILLNAAATPEDSALCFHNVYSTLKRVVSLENMNASQPEENTTKAPPSGSTNHLAEIALLRSILLGSSKAVLCCTVEHSRTSDQPGAQPLLLTLFPIICSLCDSGTEFQYLSFSLLSLWTQKLVSCLPVLRQQKGSMGLMNKASPIITEMLSRVWVSWDSPVEGVSEFVAEAFKALLEAWRLEMAEERSDYARLSDELMLKAVQMPWYARSRYKPLSLLLPYVDVTEWLKDQPSLKQELLNCMGTNFLAALASDVYTAFVQAVGNKEDSAEVWGVTWLPCVVSGLTSAESLLRSKVCAYWIPTTLKNLPEAGSVLRRHLEKCLQTCDDDSQHSRLLFAWIAVCRHIRTGAHLDLASMPEHLLLESVYCDDEDISSEALALLSTTHKKAEPVGEAETGLLRSALPYCLKVDSAPFRQKLMNSLRKLFVRVRDSCSTTIKRKIQADFIDRSVQLMDWLYRLVMEHLGPGACFQRRRTCLDIVQGWLEMIVFVETDGARKGKANSPTDVLVNYARAKGLWDFFSFSNRCVLLQCVTDGADEIQESALHILTKYFPWTPSADLVNHSSVSSEDLVTHLLRHGLMLCDSPRAYENHSGALLIRLVYQKFVKGQGLQFVSHPDEGPTSVPTKAESQSEQATAKATAAFFNNILLQKIKSSVDVAKVDAPLAAKNNPTHGMLQAACECLLSEQSELGPTPPEDWQNIVTAVVSLSSAVISLVLSVLAGGQRDNCPSFAEMGVALEQLVSGETSEDQDTTTAISPEFQLLLSWCWLNLKESCTCLGVAVTLATKKGKDGHLILTAELAQSIGDTFLTVLTHCRHRGAIEGCRNGFLQFCISLMSCQDQALSTIPASMLEKVLSSLEKDELTSSVTRRSAGLPIIVQTIAQADRRCKANKLLQQGVSRLYKIAAREQPSGQLDQTQDQSSVHALNILKALFADASLASDLLSHLSPMMQLVIQAFESPSWAVRNAATQLVSTLVTRMFGQRNKSSLSCNMMTLQELASHFPGLLAFLEPRLAESLRVSGRSVASLQPSLFLLLTLLASLGPAATSDHCHRLTSSLRSMVMNAVSSPVYFVRELSATAVVALTPLDATDASVMLLCGQLTSGQSTEKSSNTIHGTLTCLDKILASRSVSFESANTIVESLVNCGMLVSTSMTCHMICAKSVDVLAKVAPILQPTSPLRRKLLDSLVDSLFGSPAGSLMVGRSLFIQSATSLICCIVQTVTDTSSSAPLLVFVQRCLASQDSNQRSAVLDCMHRQPDILGGAEGKAIMRFLWQHFRKEVEASCLLILSRLLVTYNQSHQIPLSGHEEIDLSLIEIEALRLRFEKLSNLRAAFFPLEAMVISRDVQLNQWTDTKMAERLSSALCSWSDRLQEFSQPHQSEDLRLAAAQALSVAGKAVFSHCAQLQEKQLDRVIVCLTEACLTLLDETDSDIRRIVTRFVGSLQWRNKLPKITCMNSNLCSKVFLSYLCDELGQWPVVRQLLFNKLFTPGELSDVMIKFTQPRSQVLFEHEQNTFFSEKIIQQFDIYEVLLSLNCDNSLTACLPALKAELDLALPVLKSSIAASPVYHLYGEEEVRSALTGLMMQTQLLTNWSLGRNQVKGQTDQLQLSNQLTTDLDRLLKGDN